MKQVATAMREVVSDLQAPNGLAAVVDARSMRDINERYGRPVGDRVLAAMGRSLHRRQEGSVARLPGDQFVVVRAGIHDLADARHEIERTTHVWVFARPWRIIRASGAVGVAIWHDPETRQVAIRRAAHACR